MVKMENAEEVMQILDRFTRLKQKEIPKELDDYLQYVAKTGDTVFKWCNLKYLFREKLLNVIKHFHDTTPRVDEIPQYPNVDPFNYESMKSSLLERLELFNAAPFTIQRLCELLIDPRKQYSRIDKFMRALEKNILVSTIEPGRKRTESENGDSLDSVVNGDLSLDVNVDIDMENESIFNMEGQNGNTNGNSNGTTTTTAAATASTAVDGEVEPKEKPIATETATKHATTDDDILPHPKKAKLDLDVKDEQDKVAEKTAEEEEVISSATAAQENSTAETAVDDASSKVNADKADGKTAAEVSKPTVVDIEMPEVDNNKEVVETKKNSEESKEKMAEEKNESNKDQKDVKESDKKIEEEIAQSNNKEQGDENKTEVVAGGDEKKPIEEVDTAKTKGETAAAAEADAKGADVVEDEKIIEKQEIEKGEKEVVVAESTIESETAEKSLETVVEKKVPELAVAAVAEVAKEVNVNGSDKTDSIDKIEKEPAPSEAAEKKDIESTKAAEVSTSTPEEKKTNEIKTQTITADTGKGEAEAVVAGKKESIEEPKAAAAEESIVTATTTTTTTTETTEKTENKIDAVVDEEKKSGDSSLAAAAATTTNEAEAVATEKSSGNSALTKPADGESKVETPAADQGKTEAVQIATKESEVPIATNETIQSTAADSATVGEKSDVAIATITTSDPAATATQIPAVAPSKVVESAEATPLVTPTPIPASVPTPTLALNDQPMEDIPIEEVIQPVVDEVVMAESNAPTEMATDANEAPPPPSKDEPAGMEVDDTSQEAMDQ